MFMNKNNRKNIKFLNYTQRVKDKVNTLLIESNLSNVAVTEVGVTVLKSILAL